MSYFTGTQGSLKVDGTQLARVSGWSLTSSVETLDVTSLGDTAKDYTAGLKAASGSCLVWLYDESANPLLSKVLKTGAATDADKVTLTLGWGAKAITVSAILTTADISCRIGEVMQAQLSFTVCGDYASVAI